LQLVGHVAAPLLTAAGATKARTLVVAEVVGVSESHLGTESYTVFAAASTENGYVAYPTNSAARKASNDVSSWNWEMGTANGVKDVPVQKWSLDGIMTERFGPRYCQY
jgi:hypothetical protein